MRRAIYTTNAIEARNRQQRKVLNTEGHFSNDDAGRKRIDLASATPRAPGPSMRTPHLVAGAYEHERELLDWFDNGHSEPNGRSVGGEDAADAA